METRSITKLGIIAALFVVIMMCCVRCTLVDSGEVGIKFNKLAVNEQGKLDATSCSGYTFYCPIVTDVFTYPVYVQRVNYEPFTVTTKDAATFTMDPVLAYQIERSKATDIFAKYRKPLDEIESGYMRTAIYDAYRITANNYTSDELMGSRAKFESEVRAMLEHSLVAEGFVVTEFTSQITPPSSLREAIDAKNKAIQESLKANNEVKKAEANAQIAIAKAKGEAQALKIKADGEAYFYRTVAAALSEQIIKKNAIEKWDGKLPTCNGSGTLPMINVNGLTSK